MEYKTIRISKDSYDRIMEGEGKTIIEKVSNLCKQSANNNDSANKVQTEVSVDCKQIANKYV